MHRKRRAAHILAYCLSEVSGAHRPRDAEANICYYITIWNLPSTIFRLDYTIAMCWVCWPNSLKVTSPIMPYKISKYKISPFSESINYAEGCLEAE